MIQDKRIKWEILSHNGDATTSENGIILTSITVQEFVEQIVLPDKREWGNIKINNWLADSMIEFKHGNIVKINQELYDSVKNQHIKELFFNGGWSFESFTIKL